MICKSPVNFYPQDLQIPVIQNSFGLSIIFLLLKDIRVANKDYALHPKDPGPDPAPAVIKKVPTHFAIYYITKNHK